jgi:uncharacterized membrane protein
MSEPGQEMTKPCDQADQKPSSPNHQAVVLQIATETHATFSGPLPPPQILAQYDVIVPGAADRILCMAERQQQHRMGLEKFVIEGDSRRATAGLICGTVIALAFGGGAVYLVATGHDVNGLFLGLAPLATLVGTFIYAQRSRRQEREQRMREADQPSSRPEKNQSASPKRGKKTR